MKLPWYDPKRTLYSMAIEHGLLLLRGKISGAGRRLRLADGREMVDFSTASYLGLDTDAEIIGAVRQTIQEMGLGRCSSPLYFASDLYEQIEQNICHILGTDRALLFSSTSLANLAAICYGVPKDRRVFADQYCHRSIVEAVRLRRGNAVRYAHCDPQDLIRQIDAQPYTSNLAIITDGVFSMSGITAPISDLIRIAEERDCHIVIDDAHGFATDGFNGEGALRGTPSPVLQKLIYVGSLTKSIPGFGGFVACSGDVAKRIVRQSPQYGFSCSIPLAYVVSAAYGLALVGKDKWRKAVERLKDNWQTLRDGLATIRGPRLLGPYSPIAVITTENLRVMGILGVRGTAYIIVDIARPELCGADDDAMSKAMLRYEHTGRPLGDSVFVKKLESLLARMLTHRSPAQRQREDRNTPSEKAKGELSMTSPELRNSGLVSWHCRHAHPLALPGGSGSNGRIASRTCLASFTASRASSSVASGRSPGYRSSTP